MRGDHKRQHQNRSHPWLEGLFSRVGLGQKGRVLDRPQQAQNISGSAATSSEYFWIGRNKLGLALPCPKICDRTESVVAEA